MTAAVERLMALFDRVGGLLYDEALSQRSHAEQCAALARADGAPDHLVAAALLHDVGHLLELEGAEDGPDPDDGSDLRHEAAGARLLAASFGPTVTAPVALHVAAKRYLVATEGTYAGALSAGSVRSLARQGGPMSSDECRRFVGLAGSADAVRLRRWDDTAKDPTLRVPAVAEYRQVLDELATECPGWESNPHALSDNGF